ncbi:hypothetical protein FEM48_Zijuj09G0070400 [Ziziphus jujuba var. spinosa]|uniref:Response regulatory domain-containing protein n=1 Tax=Ziziphus jujuba var. spinosa TaxID=714518 RepID=A0A978URJ0_ZIZJJ|nr:hypothetical protein FEM48_Zijuj09G0070400 [Ziziphus jujuba var. spinosa]
MTALVVDDGITCRMLEKGLLTSYGIETQAVESGPAAIQLISSGATFHLIVIDMHLSGMNGPETIRQLRAMGVRSRIMGISILFTEKERRVFLEAGGDHYMEKRMHPERFIPILHELDNQ